LNHSGFFSVICSNHHYENEKFIQIGYSSKLGCHEPGANGERPDLYQGTSSAREHGQQEL